MVNVAFTPGSYTMAAPSTGVIQRAMNALREAEEQGFDDSHMDISTRNVLSAALTSILRRIEEKPNSYVMNDLEFSVFNRFRPQTLRAVTERRAVERYWHNAQRRDG